MSRCSGSKPDGTPCERIVGASQEYCFAHDPDRSEQRRRAARKGGKRAGRGRPMAEVAEMRNQIDDLYSSVLTGLVDPKVGAVAAQIANVRVRLMETERKIRETEELEVRLAELEAALEAHQKERSYGYPG